MPRIVIIDYTFGNSGNSILNVPKTKGHTLEEIEEHWRKGRHPREL